MRITLSDYHKPRLSISLSRDDVGGSYNHTFYRKEYGNQLPSKGRAALDAVALTVFKHFVAGVDVSDSKYVGATFEAVNKIRADTEIENEEECIASLPTEG